MWSFIKPVNLIRYLVAWRVTSSLAVLPVCWSSVLSRVLGTIIADRLPTREAAAWHEALEAWSDSGKAPPPEAQWPIQAVLFPYPGKRHHGAGEVILWELKLMGPCADHGLFLELILPAMEEAASITDSRWHRDNWVWGNFAIQAVYAAKGTRWEPVVTDGKLDLGYRATPAQWAEGLDFGRETRRRYHHLAWLTPFDLGRNPAVEDDSYDLDAKSDVPAPAVPTLDAIVEDLMERMTLFLPEKRPTVEDVWALMENDEQETLKHALRRARQFSRYQDVSLEPARKRCAGRWKGEQHFHQSIPRPLLPYLDLASILHVGQATHFGCGTFELS
jgi:hypothetical protein